MVAVPTHAGQRRFHDCSDKLDSLRNSLGLNEALYKRKAHRRKGASDSTYSGISLMSFAKKQLRWQVVIYKVQLKIFFFKD